VDGKTNPRTFKHTERFIAHPAKQAIGHHAVQDLTALVRLQIVASRLPEIIFV
jgi:hypothetical protein